MKVIEYVFKRNFKKGFFDLDGSISKKIEEITDKHFVVRCDEESCKVVLDPGESFSKEEKDKLDKVIEDNRLF